MRLMNGLILLAIAGTAQAQPRTCHKSADDDALHAAALTAHDCVKAEEAKLEASASPASDIAISAVSACRAQFNAIGPIWLRCTHSWLVPDDQTYANLAIDGQERLAHDYVIRLVTEARAARAPNRP